MSKEHVIAHEEARIKKIDNSLQQYLQELHSDPYKQSLIKLFSTSRAHYKQNNDTKVAIIGLGPTGIAASLEAYKTGFEVVAVEPRSDYTREQAFRFPIEDFKRWFNDFLNIDDIDTLPADHPIKKIADLDVFVKRMTRIDEGVVFGNDVTQELEHYEIATRHLETIFFSILSILAQYDTQNLSLIHNYKFHDYVENNGIELISTTDNAPVIINGIGYLLGCDGLHSKTREKAGIETHAKSEKKQYIAANFYQDTRVTGDKVEQFITIKDGSFLEVQNDSAYDTRKRILYPSTSKRQEQLASTYEFHSLPAARVFFTAIGTYIGIEVTNRGINNTEEERISSQCFALMRTVFGVHHSDSPNFGIWVKQHQEHYLRKGEIFEVQLRRANERVKLLENGIIYFTVGDANANAHFQTGSGALFGMQSGQVVARLLADREPLELIDNTLLAYAEQLYAKILTFQDVNITPLIDEDIIVNNTEPKGNTPPIVIEIPGLENNSTPKKKFPLPNIQELNPDRFNQVFIAIKKMKAYGKKLRNDDPVKSEKIIRLSKQLKIAINVFINHSKQHEVTTNNFHDFEKYFIQSAHSEDEIMTHHRKLWKPIVANILIAFSGVGTAILLGRAFAEAYLAVTKPSYKSSIRNVFFYTKTQSQTHIETIEKSMRSGG